MEKKSKIKKRWPWILATIIFLILLGISLIFNFTQYQKSQDLTSQKDSLKNTSNRRKRTLADVKSKNQLKSQQIKTYKTENKSLSKNSQKLTNQKTFSNQVQKYLVSFYNFHKNNFQTRKKKLSPLTVSSTLNRNLPEKNKNQINKSKSKLLNYKTFPQAQHKSDLNGIALVSYEETSPKKQNLSLDKLKSSKDKATRKTVLYALSYNTHIKKFTRIKNMGHDLNKIDLG